MEKMRFRCGFLWKIPSESACQLHDNQRAVTRRDRCAAQSRHVSSLSYELNVSTDCSSGCIRRNWHWWFQRSKTTDKSDHGEEGYSWLRSLNWAFQWVQNRYEIGGEERNQHLEVDKHKCSWRLGPSVKPSSAMRSGQLLHTLAVGNKIIISASTYSTFYHSEKDAVSVRLGISE